MKKLFHDIINLFYPHLCLLCRNPLIEGEKHVCLDCLCDMPYTKYHTNRGNPVRALFAGHPQVKDATAFLFFEKNGKTQELTHSFKYRGNKELAEYLGRMAALELNRNGIFAAVDTIIPVPLHPKKKRKRGYNQAEHIARGLADVYQYAIDTTTLYRTVHTQTQTRKSRYDRHLNVEDIFALTNHEALAGKHVLLVDDVITTGATTTACIDVLRLIPEIKISIFALSFAQHN